MPLSISESNHLTEGRPSKEDEVRGKEGDGRKVTESENKSLWFSPTSWCHMLRVGERRTKKSHRHWSLSGH